MSGDFPQTNPSRAGSHFDRQLSQTFVVLKEDSNGKIPAYARVGRPQRAGIGYKGRGTGMRGGGGSGASGYTRGYDKKLFKANRLLLVKCCENRNDFFVGKLNVYLKVLTCLLRFKLLSHA